LCKWRGGKKKKEKRACRHCYFGFDDLKVVLGGPRLLGLLHGGDREQFHHAVLHQLVQILVRCHHQAQRVACNAQQPLHTGTLTRQEREKRLLLSRKRSAGGKLMHQQVAKRQAKL